MAALVGEIFGAIVAMSILGSLFGWALRKLFGLGTALSFVVGVVAATFAGALLLSLNSSKPFLTAWIEYAIGGAIALAIMLTSDKSRARKKAQWLEITSKVDDLWNSLTVPWRDTMLKTFTHRVGIKMVFNDDRPEDELFPALDEFNKTVDDHLKIILPDITSHLKDCERQSKKIGFLSTYNVKIKQHVALLVGYMREQSALIGVRLLIARREELGLPVDQTNDLVEGRNLMKEVRQRPVEMTPELKETLVKALDLLERDSISRH
jgi:hypothetical protein